MSSERLKVFVIEAFVDASIALESFDPEQCNVNTLSALGNLVSRSVRRRVLLETLTSCDWRLIDVSDALRMGGANNVTKAIVQLNLDDELKAARKAGKAKQGRRAVSAKEGVR